MRNRGLRAFFYGMVLVAAGCGDTSPAGSTVRGFPADWPSDAERTLAPGKAPAPFTAPQIRASCAPGREFVFRAVAEGDKAATSRIRFTGGDEEMAHFEVGTAESEASQPVKWQPIKVPWTALQAHGSFDAAKTTITFESVTVPAGRHDAVVYAVREGEGEKATLTKHWFALDLPGPPVKTVVTVGGKPQLEQVLLRTSKGS